MFTPYFIFTYLTSSTTQLLSLKLLNTTLENPTWNSTFAIQLRNCPPQLVLRQTDEDLQELYDEVAYKSQHKTLRPEGIFKIRHLSSKVFCLYWLQTYHPAAIIRNLDWWVTAVVLALLAVTLVLLRHPSHGHTDELQSQKKEPSSSSSSLPS